MTGPHPAALRFRLDGPASAPVLVLSNSLGTSLEMWDPQIPALARRFRIVRYDMRGHGGSAVPPGPYRVEDLGADLLGLLDSLGIERASFAGVSLGGLVSLWLAASAPERVERVAVISAAARFPDPDRYRERAALVRAQGMGPVAASVVGRWLTPAFAVERPDVAESLRAMVASTPAEGYAACCGIVADADVRSELGAVRAALLVVAGADDEAVPPSYGEEIAGLVRGSRVTVVEHAAHLANVERPDEVTRLLLEHLGGEPAASDGSALAPAPSSQDLMEIGLAVRRAVLGDAHVERSLAGASDFDRPFQEFITRYAWGAVWAREGLDRRTRSCLTLALLTALRAENELPLHVRGALRNGLTPEEIREVILHTAVYAGVPAANAAFAVARRVLEEEAANE